MIPSNPICPVCNYATNPTYCQLPSPDQLQCGVVPLDSLPAAWWNAMWHETNQAVNQARGAVGSLITEVNNVLQGAGVCVNPSCTDQLYQAIDKIRQTIGNASIAGAVKSSSCPGEVSIDANGIMTANCLGNAASLTTIARTVVGAVNELKSTYDNCFSSTATAIGSKAPTMHASDQTTYGVGNASCYGHVKISDEYTCCVGNAADGIAASQEALYCVYDFAAGIAAGVASLGNTAGCALGTAAAGTAVTAARSDHVHPIPTSVTCANCVSRTSYTSAYSFDVALFNGCTTADGCKLFVSGCCRLQFCNTTGVLTAKTFCGALSGNATSANKALCLCNRPASGTASVACNVTFLTGCTNAECTATNRTACICGANNFFYGLAGAYLPVIRANDPGTTASKKCNVTICAYCTDASCTKTTRTFTFCSSTGKLHADICGDVSGNAAAATYATTAECIQPRICYDGRSNCSIIGVVSLEYDSGNSSGTLCATQCGLYPVIVSICSQCVCSTCLLPGYGRRVHIASCLSYGQSCVSVWSLSIPSVH